MRLEMPAVLKEMASLLYEGGLRQYGFTTWTPLVIKWWQFIWKAHILFCGQGHRFSHHHYYKRALFR